MGIFVKFKNAFSCIYWNVDLDKLRKTGMSSECDLRMWRSYFEDRWVYMRNNVDEVQMQLSRGTPQGSIGYSVVWKFCMNEILNDLNGIGIKTLAFADVFLILIGGESTLDLLNQRKFGECFIHSLWVRRRNQRLRLRKENILHAI